MSALLQHERVGQRAGPVSRSLVATTPPRKDLLQVALDGIRLAGELAIGFIVTAFSLVMEFAAYAVAVLTVPLMPFLLLVALFPAMALCGLAIVVFGKFVSLFGL